MKAVAVSEYGSIDKIVKVDLPKPGKPEGHDVLVKSATLER